MFTAMNRMSVPAAARPQQEGGAYAAVMDLASADAFAARRRSNAFRAAHGPSTGGAGGAVETFATLASVGA